MREIFWIILIILILLLLFAQIGINIQNKRDLKAIQYPPPGRIINTLHKMHLRVIEPEKTDDAPSSGITVIFESGLGNGCLSWSLVQQVMSKKVRSVSYDRAGMGWSEVAKKKRTSNQIAHELSQSLKKANIGGPYILVGHSLGGLYIRSFYDLHPNEVIGMIFVDSSHPKDVLSDLYSSKLYFKSLLFLSRFGVRKIAKDLMDKTTSEFSKIYEITQYQTKVYETIYREFINIPDSVEQINQINDFIEKPIIILTHIEGEKTKEWKELQKDFLSFSKDSKQILCSTGHNIHITMPHIVSDSIEEIINKHNQKKK